MRFDLACLAIPLLISTAATSAIAGPRPIASVDEVPLRYNQVLFKRRGGGGGGVRGGGGGGSTRSGGGGSSSSGGKTGGSSSPGNTGSTSNVGGTTRGGSGPLPSFGGGRFYGGGSSRPYRSGGTSPAGIVPFALVGAGLAFWPGVWLYGAHLYPNKNDYHYHNATSNKDESAKVLCGCSQYAECGCDDNTDKAYYDQLIGNGSYAALNKSLVNVGQYKGQKTLFINGTLPNGTTADDESSANGLGMSSLVKAAGIWPAVAVAVAVAFLV